MNIKKLRDFVEDGDSKYESTKLGTVAHKSIYKRLSQILEEESLYCYEDLKDLYKKYRDYDLTVEDY
jgi:hypothetical protein